MSRRIAIFFRGCTPAHRNDTIAQSFVQNISDAVGSIAIAKEEKWSYEIPDIAAAIKTISISLDGANILT